MTKEKKNKTVEWIKGFLPITRRTYRKDLSNIYIIIQGFKQSEAQHSQIEMNLVQNIEEIKAKEDKKTTKKDINTDRMYG